MRRHTLRRQRIVRAKLLEHEATTSLICHHLEFQAAKSIQPPDSVLTLRKLDSLVQRCLSLHSADQHAPTIRNSTSNVLLCLSLRCHQAQHCGSQSSSVGVSRQSTVEVMEHLGRATESYDSSFQVRYRQQTEHYSCGIATLCLCVIQGS